MQGAILTRKTGASAVIIGPPWPGRICTPQIRNYLHTSLKIHSLIGTSPLQVLLLAGAFVLRKGRLV